MHSIQRNFVNKALGWDLMMRELQEKIDFSSAVNKCTSGFTIR